jgi:transposase-like protein
VAGRWVYLYQAVDSTGGAIDFMLSPKRDLVAAKHFLQLASGHTPDATPRVINVGTSSLRPKPFRLRVQAHCNDTGIEWPH